MATIGAPQSFAQATTAGVTQDYIFAANGIRIELQDKLDALALNVVNLEGDLAGAGSDTLRITRVGGVGFAQKMTAMASETSPVSPSTYTSGYTEVTTSLHGIGYEATYDEQVYGAPGRILSLDELVALFPANWLATFRYKMCVLGSAFTTIFGTSGAAWTMDDELDLIAHFTETIGAMGPITSVRSARQVTQLREAARAESAMKFSSDFKAIQYANLEQIGDLLGLGVNIVKTSDVQQSAGDDLGFAMCPGALGWARASTGAIRPANVSMQAMYLPEFGGFIEGAGNSDNQISGFKALAWFGMAESSSTLAPRARIRSLAA